MRYGDVWKNKRGREYRLKQGSYAWTQENAGKVILHPLDGGTNEVEPAVLIHEDQGWTLVECGDGGEVRT
jgi:hypothetical protein